MPTRLRVRNWDRIGNASWPTLLLGNGASINVWADFSYSQLFQRAQLNAPANQVFSDLSTVNFETVLESLWHAERVLIALGRKSSDVTTMYEHVRTELAAAVRRVHVPWDRVPDATLTAIAEVMDRHSIVFTLNYDLLTYWALMENTATTYIGDYFWNHGSVFDPTNTGLAGGRTGLLYLHGGAHLWQDSISGKSGKWTSQGSGLLTSLSLNFLTRPNRQPLFVSEGTSAQKMRVIRRSDYLSFARQQLVDDISDTAVFGVNFGRQDDHIVDALRAGGRRKIAISVRPGSNEQQTAAMARYQEKLPDQDLAFFDSTTHPLGDPSLAAPKLPRLTLAGRSRTQGRATSLTQTF